MKYHPHYFGPLRVVSLGQLSAANAEQAVLTGRLAAKRVFLGAEMSEALFELLENVYSYISKPRTAGRIPSFCAFFGPC